MSLPELVTYLSPFSFTNFSSLVVSLSRQKSQELEVVLKRVFKAFKKSIYEELFPEEMLLGTPQLNQDHAQIELQQPQKIYEKFVRAFVKGLVTALQTLGGSEEEIGQDLPIYAGVLLDWIIKLNRDGNGSLGVNNEGEELNESLLHLVFYSRKRSSEAPEKLDGNISLCHGANVDSAFGKILLSSLFHVTSWNSRQSCFQFLLKELVEKRGVNPSDTEYLNPSRCLDFITAFLYPPEKFSRPEQEADDCFPSSTLYKFSISEINLISDLIIEEETLHGQKRKVEEELRAASKQIQIENASNHITSNIRLSLLVACIKQNVEVNLYPVTQHIYSRSTSVFESNSNSILDMNVEECKKSKMEMVPQTSSNPSPSFCKMLSSLDREPSPLLSMCSLFPLSSTKMEPTPWCKCLGHCSCKQKSVIENKAYSMKSLSPAEKLLVGLYLEFPSLVHTINSKYSSDILFSTTDNSSTLDFAIHRIAKQMLDSETAVMASVVCKKLGRIHPSLVIRYLPTIGGLLSGTHFLTHSQFLRKQHHTLFIHVLGILDVLRPHVFMQMNLSQILEPYFQLLSSSGLHTDFYGSLIQNFINFLCQFPLEKVGEFIKYKALLVKLQLNYPSITNFDTLIGILDKYSNAYPTKPNTITSPSPQLLFPEEEIEKCRQSVRIDRLNFQKSEVTSVHNALVDLDLVSSKTPVLLKVFVKDILQFMIWSKYDDNQFGGTLRNLAYTMVLRFMHQSNRFNLHPARLPKKKPL
eukprot:TRINITY_DN8943_c0_g1_i1.p1 TRINITY_DN8943_c0_g1~~TRINITY_DN8943_c0_g1_i1.p1  ORF type:complete len:784 (+),score=159.29 TRINITY_DN8943_c0_g1_i1:97-2352(+)